MRAGRVITAALIAVLSAALVLAGPAPTASAQDGPVNETPPTISGKRLYDARLVADPGQWSPPSGLTYEYRWFRGDDPVWGDRGARRIYRPNLKDLYQRLRVRVTAIDEAGHRSRIMSARTGRIRRAPMSNETRPRVKGTLRFGHSVRATRGEWVTAPSRVQYRWLRNGNTIKGATGRRYTFKPHDVGKRIRVRVRATAPGYEWGSRRSARRHPIRHRVGVRRDVTYNVVTRGRITTNVRTFRLQAAATFADARGWRGAGVRFTRVPRGGSFTLVLAAANRMTSFSPACSSMWSCRVGRYVIINQERWKHASPAWNRAGRSRRSYRHMVVNHESGHWLGHGHRSCPGPGRRAPVMMQQSKGTQGCRFNPWPTLSELTATRSRTVAGRAGHPDLD